MYCLLWAKEADKLGVAMEGPLVIVVAMDDKKGTEDVEEDVVEDVVEEVVEDEREDVEKEDKEDKEDKEVGEKYPGCTVRLVTERGDNAVALLAAASATKLYCCLVVVLLLNLKDNEGECLVDGVTESLFRRFIRFPPPTPILRPLPPPPKPLVLCCRLSKFNLVGKLKGRLRVEEEEDNKALGVFFNNTFLLELDPLLPRPTSWLPPP